IGAFAISFFTFGLADYYDNITVIADPVYLEGTSIISDLAMPIAQPLEILILLGSNPYLLTFVSVALVASVTTIVVTQKAMPVLILYIAFFISLFLSSLNVVGLISTVSSTVALSFAVIAFSVWKILDLKAWSNSNGRKGIFASAIAVGLFLLTQVPLIANFTSATQGNTFANLDQFYSIGNWLKTNVSGDDRILNGGTLAGYYLDGFSLMNLTHSYPSALITSEQKLIAGDSGREATMNEELNVVIWQNPNKPELIYPILSYYNISYIVLLPELRSSLEGAERYANKPFSNEIYTNYFDSYDFLQANFSSGLSRIYQVN
ncbi:MAG: hypothetical protein ACRD47_15550, partial [Nitrososphaeraceae archaeon]